MISLTENRAWDIRAETPEIRLRDAIARPEDPVVADELIYGREQHVFAILDAFFERGRESGKWLLEKVEYADDAIDVLLDAAHFEKL